MSKTKKSKRIPKFKSEEEEVEFWDTHSTADYWDQFKPVKLTLHPSIKKPSDLSPRCPHHQNQVLYTRWRTIQIANGFATLNRMRELYCPRGDYTRLAPETETLIKKTEAAFKRIHKSEKSAA